MNHLEPLTAEQFAAIKRDLIDFRNQAQEMVERANIALAELIKYEPPKAN